MEVVADGMRVVRSELELGHRLNEAQRESMTAFGSTVFH